MNIQIPFIVVPQNQYKKVNSAEVISETKDFLFIVAIVFIQIIIGIVIQGV